MLEQISFVPEKKTVMETDMEFAWLVVLGPSKNALHLLQGMPLATGKLAKENVALYCSTPH